MGDVKVEVIMVQVVIVILGKAVVLVVVNLINVCIVAITITLWLLLGSTQITIWVIQIGLISRGIAKLKQFLLYQFHTKDSGKLQYQFLGLKHVLTYLREHMYLIFRWNMYVGRMSQWCFHGPKSKNFGRRGSYLETLRYHQLIEKLNYLTITILDIAYAISIVSQFLEAPRVPHWDAVTCIVHYVKWTPGLSILYRRNGNLRVDGTIDVDWSGSPTDRRSNRGYCMFLHVNIVAWKSKKQIVVTW